MRFSLGFSVAIAMALPFSLAVFGPTLANGATTEASKENQRTVSQEAKRRDAVAKLTLTEAIGRISRRDDPMERMLTMDTEHLFKWPGGLTDPVRSDNLLRAFIDRTSGDANYQV